MKTVIFCFILFFNNPNSLEDLITSLEIRSSEEISNYFDSNSEIIINEKVARHIANNEKSRDFMLPDFS